MGMTRAEKQKWVNDFTKQLKKLVKNVVDQVESGARMDFSTEPEFIKSWQPGERRVTHTLRSTSYKLEIYLPALEKKRRKR